MKCVRKHSFHIKKLSFQTLILHFDEASTNEINEQCENIFENYCQIVYKESYLALLKIIGDEFKTLVSVWSKRIRSFEVVRDNRKKGWKAGGMNGAGNWISVKGNALLVITEECLKPEGDTEPISAWLRVRSRDNAFFLSLPPSLSSPPLSLSTASIRSCQAGNASCSSIETRPSTRFEIVEHRFLSNSHCIWPGSWKFLVETSFVFRNRLGVRL